MDISTMSEKHAAEDILVQYEAEYYYGVCGLSRFSNLG